MSKFVSALFLLYKTQLCANSVYYKHDHYPSVPIMVLGVIISIYHLFFWNLFI